jgi:hypothetical protein
MLMALRSRDLQAQTPRETIAEDQSEVSIVDRRNPATEKFTVNKTRNSARRIMLTACVLSNVMQLY